jgi:hypothetical protein
MVNSLITAQGPGGLVRHEPGPERTPDIPALYESLDRTIQADAEGFHDQRNWVTLHEHEDGGPQCGIAGCLCGWRALQDGGVYSRLTEAVTLPDGTVLGGFNAWMSWTKWGAERFGLSMDTADLLFHEDNTIEDLKSIVDRISAGELR